MELIAQFKNELSFLEWWLKEWHRCIQVEETFQESLDLLAKEAAATGLSRSSVRTERSQDRIRQKSDEYFVQWIEPKIIKLYRIFSSLEVLVDGVQEVLYYDEIKGNLEKAKNLSDSREREKCCKQIISYSEGFLTSLEEKIHGSLGLVKCLRCKSWMPKEAKFCGNCGAILKCDVSRNNINTHRSS